MSLCKEEEDWVEAEQLALAVSYAPDSDCLPTTHSEANRRSGRYQATFAEPPLPKSMPWWILHQMPDVSQTQTQAPREERGEERRERKKECKESEMERRK